MRKIFTGTFLVVAFMSLLSACYNDNEYDLYPNGGKACDSTNVTYSQTVAPIMSANCNVCHSTAIASGGIITDNYNDLSTIANSGSLWNALNGLNGAILMPKGGSKLSDCDLGKIKKWINLGVPNN